MELNDKIVIYRTADGQTSIDVKLEDETVWLSANQMANLFDRDEKTIRKHINNVFSEGELEKENDTQKMRADSVKQLVAFYSLKILIHHPQLPKPPHFSTKHNTYQHISTLYLF